MFFRDDKDQQLKQLWTETRIGSILRWDYIEDEAERLLESDEGTRQTATDTHVDQDLGNDQGVEWEETDSYNEVIFRRRRPDSIAIDWNNKILHVLEFKRTSDQRHTHRERGESRAQAQHDVLVRSLEKVAEEAEGENKGWTSPREPTCLAPPSPLPSSRKMGSSAPPARLPTREAWRRRRRRGHQAQIRIDLFPETSLSSSFDSPSSLPSPLLLLSPFRRDIEGEGTRALQLQHR